MVLAFFLDSCALSFIVCACVQHPRVWERQSRILYTPAISAAKWPNQGLTNISEEARKFLASSNMFTHYKLLLGLPLLSGADKKLIHTFRHDVLITGIVFVLNLFANKYYMFNSRYNLFLIQFVKKFYHSTDFF